MNMVRQKIYEALSPVLSGGETLVVGFSGGADSVTLLHALTTLKSTLNFHVVAVHIDHQLRGEESARDRFFAENFCKQLSVPFLLYTYDVGKIASETGRGVEETGRDIRYEAFADAASSFKNAYIVTAHTADDNVETILLHLCRGCGIKGLKGISSNRDGILRPMLACTRSEIEAYCEECGLSYVTDSTNDDIAYTRNRVRHRVVPELKSINPSLSRAMTRMASHMTEADDYFEREVACLFPSLQTVEPGKYDRKQWLAVHSFLQTLLLEKAARQHGLSTDDYHLVEMRRCLNEGGCLSLPNRYRFVVGGEYAYFLQDTEEQPFCASISPGETISFFSKRYRLSVVSKQEYEQKLKFYEFLFKNACDYDMISGVITLRSRAEGDAFRPVGRGCTKTLKKLFNEAAILSEKRVQIPVLCDQNGIVLIDGFGCDERVKITKATERVLLLENVKE